MPPTAVPPAAPFSTAAPGVHIPAPRRATTAAPGVHIPAPRRATTAARSVPSPLALLAAGIPLTLLIDLAAVGGPDSRSILATEHGHRLGLRSA